MLAGQWGVASLQGFASISAGLFFASVKVAVRQARDMKVQRQRIRALRAEVLETVVA
jgi:hypothetical protein